MMKKFLPSLLKLKEALQTGQRIEFFVNNLLAILNETSPFGLSEMEARVLNEIIPNLTTPPCIPLNLKLFQILEHREMKLLGELLVSLNDACEKEDGRKLWAKFRKQIPAPNMIGYKPFQLIEEVANSLLRDEKPVILFFGLFKGIFG